MKKMKEYFNDEAANHDEFFIQKMGLTEFYDVIEQELNHCRNRNYILVLGCGSGLEIERIKFPSNVVGVDISEKMLEVLSRKKTKYKNKSDYYLYFLSRLGFRTK